MTAPEAPAMPMPTPIPPVEDFPVQWESPEEAFLLWEQEQLHFPHAMTPLSGTFICSVIQNGLGAHLRRMGAPVAGVLGRRINGFIYQAAVPDFALIEGTEERMKETVGREGFAMYQRWVNELQPQVEALNQRLIDFDYASASDAELKGQFDRLLNTVVEMWDIHFQLLPGFYTAPVFKQVCAEMLGLTGLEAYEMMQGSPNKSVESGSKLWHLAQSVSPALRGIIEGRDSATALKELEASDEGRAFLADLQAYLDEYGWRTGSFDLIVPSWIERPDLALDQVRLMFRVANDPAADQEAGARRAEELANQFRAKLAGAPEALGQFDFLLERAREYPQLQENHNFYLDQKFFAVARLPINEIGSRMAKAGVIAEREDIHYLQPEQITAFFEGDRTDLRPVVAREKANLEHWKTLTAPLALGSRPPVEQQDPLLNDFFGKSVVLEAPDAKSLQGSPSSRGKVTGTARVIRTLDEADRVEEGDILVCDMTTPAWTPLFASLSAIVSDSGGPLSHCAIVAREYGVPCVTGTRIATSTIPDGATITVDGDTGVVTIL